MANAQNALNTRMSARGVTPKHPPVSLNQSQHWLQRPQKHRDRHIAWPSGIRKPATFVAMYKNAISKCLNEPVKLSSFSIWVTLARAACNNLEPLLKFVLTHRSDIRECLEMEGFVFTHISPKAEGALSLPVLVCPSVRSSVRPYDQTCLRDYSGIIFQIFLKLGWNILWVNISDNSIMSIPSH